MIDLQQYEGAFHQLFKSSADSVILVDNKGNIILVNKIVEHMFGYQPEELIGKRLEVLIPPRFQNDHINLQHDYIDRPRTRFMGSGLILYAQRRDGSEFPVEVSLSPIETKSGIFVTSAIRDISDRIRTQKQLEQHVRELSRSNAELEQFAYVASHDLQEPLRIVSSFAQLLGQRYEGKLDKDADEFIGYIVDEANRMRVLINDLLAFSRISTKEKEFEPIDVNEVVQRVLQNLQFSIEEIHAEVTWDSLPIIAADTSQMGQLFQNLISNAIKFHGEEPPQIHISAKQEVNEFIFTVKDNGIGIEPEYADRIFLLFQRLHAKDKYKGTGLGLAICKKIIERHGGRIWVESKPSQGSSFLFTIPILN